MAGMTAMRDAEKTEKGFGMDYAKTAEQIFEKVGGAGNIDAVTHCVTRLRLNLKSMDGVDEEAVRKIPGVAGVVNQGGQFQVVIGQSVPQVYAEFVKLGDFSSKQEKPSGSGEKKGALNTILDTIAGIFLPIMPIIAGAGMIKALLAILKAASLIDTGGMEYYFLNFVADAAYYFLPVYLGASAAKKFGCNMFMGMFMGAMLLHPNFSALAEQGDMVSVFGLPVRIATYSSSVVPIILIVWTLSYVQKFVEKIVPDAIKFVARPLLTVLIMMPVAFCVLGPLGSFLGDGLVSILLAIDGVAPWILPTVIGAFMPYLVMTGMHYSLLPAYVSELSMFGHETVIGPGNLPSNIAQGGAALAVAVKTKNREFKELAVSGGFTALLGITEPVLYGVHMQLKRTLIAVSVGGGLGGLYAGITGVQRFGGGGAGLAALGLYIGDDPMNLVNAVISCIIAFAVSFILVLVLGFDDMPSDQMESQESEAPALPGCTFQAPVSGKMCGIAEVADQAFASKALGDGIGIVPSEGHIVSPCDGTIEAAYETGHAFGIKTAGGTEVLLHIGMDTVRMDGRGFTAHVKQGDHVKAGDPLVDVDLDAVRTAGFDTTVVLVVCDAGETGTVSYGEDRAVAAGDTVMRLG